MTGKNEDYRVGDRVQKTERRGEGDRIYPGTRGFVTAVSELGGITAYWDNGMETAVTDRRQIRPVPIEEELKLFSTTPCMLMGDSEAEWDARCNENGLLMSTMEGFAEQKGCMWVVKRTFIDAAHKMRNPRFELVDGGALSEIVDRCDVKNGIDIGFSAKRIPKARSMMIIAHGQGYSSREHGSGIVTELLECRLVGKATTELYREKIDEGMSTRGGHIAHAFFAIHRHEPLAPCIRDCRAIASGREKSPDLER